MERDRTMGGRVKDTACQKRCTLPPPALLTNHNKYSEQWPASEPRFTASPSNPIISSSFGRLFSDTNNGSRWHHWKGLTRENCEPSMPTNGVHAEDETRGSHADVAVLGNAP
jgi:hypothetical protein